MDPRTPVLVGVARYTHRPESKAPADRLSPLQHMERVSRMAAEDAVGADSAAALCQDLDSVVAIYSMLEVVMGSLKQGSKAASKSKTFLYKNPPKSLANCLGATRVQPNQLLLSDECGNSPQRLLNEVCARIARGEVSSSVIAGAEAFASVKDLARAGLFVQRPAKGFRDGDVNAEKNAVYWGDAPDGELPVMPDPFTEHASEVETAHSVEVPIAAYPLLDHARRRRLQHGVQQGRQESADLFAGFSKVAAACPEHAWFPKEHSPEELMLESKRNRMVGHPYTKLMCSVVEVDMAAGLMIMSVEEAQRRGVPREKWVFLHGCGDCAEPKAESLVQRPDLSRSYAMQAAGEEARRMAGLESLDEVQYIELYSCFPVCTAIAQEEFGLSTKEDRPFTVTGGMPYHGGPGGNFSTHGIAALVERLRTNPGSFGLLHGNGGLLEKQSVGIYSTTPYHERHPESPTWQRRDPSEYALSPNPVEVPAVIVDGTGVIEAYSVVERQKMLGGGKIGVVLGRIESGPHEGKRFLANTQPGADTEWLTAADPLGHRGHLKASECGKRTVFSPIFDDVREFSDRMVLSPNFVSSKL